MRAHGWDAFQTLRDFHPRFWVSYAVMALAIGIVYVSVALYQHTRAELRAFESESVVSAQALHWRYRENAHLPPRWVERVAEPLREAGCANAPYQVAALPVHQGKRRLITHLVFANPDFGQLVNWSVQTGRMFTAAEIQSGQRVCVVGDSLPVSVGEHLLVGKRSCEVIGTLAPQAGHPFVDLEPAVLLWMPARAIERFGIAWQPNHWFWMGPQAEGLLSTMQQQLAVPWITHVDVRNWDRFSARWREQLERLARQLTSLGIAVTTIAGLLLAHTLALQNRFRRAEWGIRLAQGQSLSQVFQVLLMEYLLISVGMIVLGVLLGQGFASLVGTPTWSGKAFLTASALVVMGTAGVLARLYTQCRRRAPTAWIGQSL